MKLVVEGYDQKYGEAYNETFSHIISEDAMKYGSSKENECKIPGNKNGLAACTNKRRHIYGTATEILSRFLSPAIPYLS